MHRTSFLALCLCVTAVARAADIPPATKPGWTVIEDDNTRIEELRVRGQTQKVTIQPKNGVAPAYEIIVGNGSHELSPGAGSTRGAIGKSVWRVLDF